MSLKTFLHAQLKRWFAVKDILHCLYFYSIRKRIYTYLLLIFTGVLTKILALLSFLVVIQAVIALVMPTKVIAVLQKFNSAKLTDLLSNNLGLAAYGSIVVVLIATVSILFLNRNLWNRLSSNMLAEELIKGGLWKLSNDTFMIEQFNSSSYALLRVLIAASYLLLLTLMLMLFSIKLVLLLLPLLIVMVFLQLAAMVNEFDQKKQLAEKKKQLIKAHRTATQNASEDSLTRYLNERRSYLTVRLCVDNKALLNSIWLTILSSALLLIIVYSVTKVPDIDLTFLAGYVILFVFAVRGILSSLREISTSFNVILNLRKYRNIIVSLLKNIPAN